MEKSRPEYVRMNKFIIKICFAAMVTLLSCAAINSGKVTGYNLAKPDYSIILPDTLREISGLAITDSNTFACLQDENGILFLFDMVNQKIITQYSFHIDGDYEGITRVDSTIYILRSDGVLFEVSNYQNTDFKTKQYNTGIPANNNEGLCYDNENNRLLIACKGKIGKGSENKDKRAIYGFDLERKKLNSEPVFDINVHMVKSFAIKEKLDLPTKKRKKKEQVIADPVIKFRPSAIGIHPKTGRLFILSASDYLLFVFRPDGTIENIEKLDPQLFNKAEGISFFANGDMLICNEAQDKKATVYKFKYKFGDN